MRQARKTWAAAGLAALAALAAFAPALQNGWVAWDDELNVLYNARIRAFTAENVGWMLTSVSHGNYMPLGFLSWALDFKFWGLDARGYHLTSLLFHAVNAMLAFALMKRLLRLGRPERGEADLDAAAFLGALLFSLHPLRVEPVAWIGGRAELIGTELCLASLVFYLDRKRAAALVLLALSVGAKPLALTMPAVLLVLDAWPLKRDLRQRRVWLEKLPFAAVAAVAGALAWKSKSAAAAWGWDVYTPAHRLAQAGWGLAFYVRKTLWPAGLSPLYAVPRRFSPVEPRFLLSWATVAAAAVWARPRPAWRTALLAYAALLFPVLGFFQSGLQFTADRYSYLACFGFAALAAAGWREAARTPARPAASAAAGAVVLALALLSGRQTAAWRDTVSFWSRAVEVEPWSPVARFSLGHALLEAGRAEEGRRQLEELLASNPNCAVAERFKADPTCAESARLLGR